MTESHLNPANRISSGRPASSQRWLAVKLSARAAGISASYTLVVVLLVWCINVGVSWLLGLSIRGSWKFAIGLAFTMSAVLFSGVLASTLADLASRNKRVVAMNPVFRGIALILGTYGLSIVLWMALIWGLWWQGNSAWCQLIPAALLLMVWCAWPRAIHVDESGIRQRDLWGREKRLSYKAIDYITYDPKNHETAVVGWNVEIIHRWDHVDPDLFHQVLIERTGRPVRKGES